MALRGQGRIIPAAQFTNKRGMGLLVWFLWPISFMQRFRISQRAGLCLVLPVWKFHCFLETDPLNHLVILAANAGHQCDPKYPASLANPSESASQSARGRLKADWGSRLCRCSAWLSLSLTIIYPNGDVYVCTEFKILKAKVPIIFLGTVGFSPLREGR